MFSWALAGSAIGVLEGGKNPTGLGIPVLFAASGSADDLT